MDQPDKDYIDLVCRQPEYIDLMSDEEMTQPMSDDDDDDNLIEPPINYYAKTWFLTYPQNDTPKETVLDRIKEHYGDDLDYALVCQEDHKDDMGKHLHALIRLHKKIRVRSWRIFDSFTDGRHGHFETARSVNKTIKYVCKDGNVCSHGRDWKELLKAAKGKKSTRAAVIHQAIAEGKTLIEIEKEHGDYLLQHLQKTQYFLDWREESMRTHVVKDVAGFVDGNAEDWSKQIVDWLTLNMRKKRNHRQEQLWICGKTRSGKSHFLMTMMDYYNGYLIPDDGNWYEDYEDSFEFAYLDEYSGCKKIGWLNKFAEGGPMTLNRRGRAPKKRARDCFMPVIICSNMTIGELYVKAREAQVEALQTRFLEIVIPEGKQLDIIIN